MERFLSNFTYGRVQARGRESPQCFGLFAGGILDSVSNHRYQQQQQQQQLHYHNHHHCRHYHHNVSCLSSCKVWGASKYAKHAIETIARNVPGVIWQYILKGGYFDCQIHAILTLKMYQI